MEQIILAVILIGIIFLYVSQIISIEMTSLLILPVLAIACPFMKLNDILSGLSSPATITIICMFILSAGMMKAGSLNPLTKFLSSVARKNFFLFTLCLATIIPLLSAFINNTPLVVMMIPVLFTVARNNNIAPSKLLIPLSFLSILGGTCTLIGTNTNILVNQIYIDLTGQKGFGMFDFTPLGLGYMLAGSLFIIFVIIKILPNRNSLSALMTRKDTAKYVTEVCLPEKSPLSGKSIKKFLQREKNIKIIELVRHEQIFAGKDVLPLDFESGDALIIEASAENIANFMGQYFELPEAVTSRINVNVHAKNMMLDEAVVLPDSDFVGNTLGELKLFRTYGVIVLGVQRGGRHHRKSLAEMEVRAGDVMLVQSDDAGFEKLRVSNQVLLLDNKIDTTKKRYHSYLAIAIMLGVMGVASLTPVPLAIAAIVGCMVLVMTKIITMNEGLAAVDSKVVLLLVGAIPLGIAMEKSGLALTLANAIFDIVKDYPHWVFLSVFYLFTSLITETLSNKATAVLLTPIAIQFSIVMGVDPKPLLMAICFGASASFMTPIGYETNIIVMGPGGYKFTDFLKVGIPMNLIMWIIATILIPQFYPF